MNWCFVIHLAVAQLGRVRRLDRRGRGFESYQSDFALLVQWENVVLTRRVQWFDSTTGYVMKECIKCHQVKPEAFYYKHTGTRLRGECKECFDLNATAKRYGLTPERLTEMYVNQGGMCAICGLECVVNRNLSVDHDHDCFPGKQSCGNCVRGLLCQPCNQAIGLMKNSPERLMAAARYLS